MSESEDEEFAFYGKPLEPLDEENIGRKKPFSIQDQIATDKHGRRRFHGAFTGGFSAGFFNSVGTLEGWAPSQFKSSRESKADVPRQRPEDFMDDEDTDEFGIAPTLLRAKPEYSGSKAKKRKFEISDGPIPGEPVLESILEPTSITIGMKLLMRLGWKPGQGVGPMLTWFEKMGEVDPQDLGVDPNSVFPPDPIKEHYIKAKSDRFGLGYVGLSREPVLQQPRFSLFDDPLRIDENKKKLSIRGQAFGVGAFEVEDEDIYAKDDMSSYDFALETSATLREARKKEREKEKEQLAICQNYDCIDGFEPAKRDVKKKKYYPPPELPLDFDPHQGARKSRFGPEVRGKTDNVKGKHILTSDDRASILGDSIRSEKDISLPINNLENTDEEKFVQVAGVPGFRPFVSEPAKQTRYDKYLGFIRIGAKDALKAIQPTDMSEWEREREANEFEQASRLYRPLSGMMGDKFSRGGLLDDSADPLAPVSKTDSEKMKTLDPWAKAAQEKKFGKLTRFISDWDPVPILCRRMNIPDPRNSDITMAKIAEDANKRKPKFSVFDFLDTAKQNLFTNDVEKQEETKVQEEKEKTISEPENQQIKVMSLPEPKTNNINVIEFDDPKEKMDLFKAIFASSDEDSDTDINDSKQLDKANNKSVASANILRNTSPPRGIFANLDLDALKPKPLPPKDLKESETIDSTVGPMDTVKEVTTKEEVDPSLLYGPSLPSKPVFISQAKYQNEDESSSDEDDWVEKKETQKKKKHSKHHKKEKKKGKHKKKKKKH